MSNDTNGQNTSVDDNALETKKRMEALALAIHEELGSLTQEELERLYAVVVLMEIEQGDSNG